MIRCRLPTKPEKSEFAVVSRRRWRHCYFVPAPASVLTAVPPSPQGASRRRRCSVLPHKRRCFPLPCANDGCCSLWACAAGDTARHRQGRCQYVTTRRVCAAVRPAGGQECQRVSRNHIAPCASSWWPVCTLDAPVPPGVVCDGVVHTPCVCAALRQPCCRSPARALRVALHRACWARGAVAAAAAAHTAVDCGCRV